MCNLCIIHNMMATKSFYTQPLNEKKQQKIESSKRTYVHNKQSMC